jgi:ankyrin repeat protein
MFILYLFLALCLFSASCGDKVNPSLSSEVSLGNDGRRHEDPPSPPASDSDGVNLKNGDEKTPEFIDQTNEADEADVNAKDKDSDDNKALYNAVEQNNITLVEQLINQGVNLKAKDNNGNSALHLAVKGGKGKDIIKLLVNAEGIDINAVDNDSNTALHLAVKGSKNNIIALLVKTEGIDVNARGENFRRPLHLAVQAGNKDAVELLLASGANVRALDRSAKLPLHYVANKDKDIAALLMAAEAERVTAERSWFRGIGNGLNYLYSMAFGKNGGVYDESWIEVDKDE